MAKIYKLTDRIEVKVHDLTIKLSPLNIEQKTELHILVSSGDTKSVLEAAKRSIKYCVKSIVGLEDCEGEPYELTFEKDGCLSDSNIEDLLNMEYSQQLTTICSTLAGGVPGDNFRDATGQPIEGVSIVSKPSKRKPKAKK